MQKTPRPERSIDIVARLTATGFAESLFHMTWFSFLEAICDFAGQASLPRASHPMDCCLLWKTELARMDPLADSL